MGSEGTDDEPRRELRQAVQATLFAGSARVRYAMQANPPELADYETGEGVADFVALRSRVAYSGAPAGGPSESSGQPTLEQVVDRDVTYMRVGGSAGEWIDLNLGDEKEFAGAGDGFLELLSAPGPVARIATSEQFDGKPARRYSLEIDPPRSSLRDHLSRAFGVKGPSRFWLDAWVDAEGYVRRIAAYDHAPGPDGALPRGAVRTTVEYSELGIPAPVVVPPTT
jgi:hypothetical protein